MRGGSAAQNTRHDESETTASEPFHAHLPARRRDAAAARYLCKFRCNFGPPRVWRGGWVVPLRSRMLRSRMRGRHGGRPRTSVRCATRYGIVMVCVSAPHAVEYGALN